MVANECGTIGTMQGATELIDLASDDEDDTKGMFLSAPRASASLAFTTPVSSALHSAFRTK